MREVIEFRAEALLAQQRRRLEKVDSLRGLELWRDEMVERNALRDGAYGCPLGSIANEIADHDEDTRRIIANHFDEWLQIIVDTIDRLKARGVLRGARTLAHLPVGCWPRCREGTCNAKTSVM